MESLSSVGTGHLGKKHFLGIKYFVHTRFQRITSQRLLDLCLKFFQDFVTWEISQSERKPEPVESALPSAAE